MNQIFTEFEEFLESLLHLRQESLKYEPGIMHPKYLALGNCRCHYIHGTCQNVPQARTHKENKDGNVIFDNLKSSSGLEEKCKVHKAPCSEIKWSKCKSKAQENGKQCTSLQSTLLTQMNKFCTS